MEISQFSSTMESENVPGATPNNEEFSWADDLPEGAVEKPATPVPEVLRNLAKKGVQFEKVHFWGLQDEKPKLVKNQSIYFSVDTIITSQDILFAFDKAGIDVSEISCIQRKASNKSWIVTFDSPVTKEAALEVASIEIDGNMVFLGDCEHRLVLVKIYEAPAELPDTALIGRLSHYGRVLSFRRDKIADNIDNGVRTARMELHRHVPSIINLAGELIRIWYPSQPKTCRNCGGRDHLAKNCASVRCLNCEQPGHRSEECEESLMCGVCKAFDHSMADCPYVLFSANVSSVAKPTVSKNGEENKQHAMEQRENQKAEREKKKADLRKQQQQQVSKKGEIGRGSCGTRGDDGPREQRSRDDRLREDRPRDHRSREECPREGKTRDGRERRISDREDEDRRDR